MSEPVEVICGEPFAACFCALPPGHTEPHLCPCQGSWTGTETGEHEIVVFPNGQSFDPALVSALRNFGGWFE